MKRNTLLYTRFPYLCFLIAIVGCAENPSEVPSKSEGNPRKDSPGRQASPWVDVDGDQPQTTPPSQPSPAQIAERMEKEFTEEELKLLQGSLTFYDGGFPNLDPSAEEVSIGLTMRNVPVDWFMSQNRFVKIQIVSAGFFWGPGEKDGQKVLGVLNQDLDFVTWPGAELYSPRSGRYPHRHAVKQKDNVPPHGF